MGKALIIAEKPSVASDIAKALGGFKKRDDCFESDTYVIASAVGHLLELTPPPGVEVARGKWSFKHLPVIPDHFDLQPIAKNESRLKQLAKLIKRSDVAVLINACDAGREGELIFRNIVRYTKAKQPIQRLWLQSMTPVAIREGFTRLRDDADLQPLADAAVSRAEADWLVGINGTRAMTAFNSKLGGFYKTTVGRVQTPTLAILVEREEKIRKFVPRDFWEIIGTFDAAAGQYAGRWFDEKFVKENGKEADPDRKAERLWNEADAEAIKAKCLGKPGVVTEESKPSTQFSPLLYDLTSLQREANARFGFSAKNTLAIAQALYEKHKVLTYPRTDSRALPEDYLGPVRQVLEMLNGTAYAPFAGKILQQGWVRPHKRIFNNAKVSDHFAIIPTPQAPKSLTEPERKLYDLVTKRFLAVFYPAAEFLTTTRITRVEGEPFKSVGKVITVPGWLEVYGKEAPLDEVNPHLAPVQSGERVHTSAVEVKQSTTKPPPRYTEATLLSAMEGAGKLVEDDELREAMREKGLGTPATRAAIIEGLVYEQYVHRQGRELQPIAKAFSLMELLRGLGVEELTKPELTGDWEFRLRQIQRRELSRPAFMSGIAEMTQRIVDRAKTFEQDTIPGDFGVLGVPCPKCGGEVHEKYKAYQCVKSDCDFAIWKILCSRMFENEEVEQLIRERQIGPLSGFRSKMGKPFNAGLKLNAEFKVEFDFGTAPATEESTTRTPLDFTGQEPLGSCPRCGARVFDGGMNYVCEKSVDDKRTCTFRAGKLILQQPLDSPQIKKLLATGRTDLLKGFVSKKTGRKFEAFLVLKDGTVQFEFVPRERKTKTTAPKEPAPKLDFTGLPPLGKCPKCGGRVFAGVTHYVCEKSQAEKRPCKFKVAKTILEQPVDEAQLRKLLAGEKTDLLTKFVSSKTGRPFQAYLVMDEKGKVTFDFPLREQGGESTTRTPESPEHGG
ncbi:MAG: DNA topoisomerase III [Verrucomicrobia bacterium]|jgi:DNA topoisomerase-3|nr:DNA topoisomerase III [Verrucomicrobiota bacterium]